MFNSYWNIPGKDIVCILHVCYYVTRCMHIAFRVQLLYTMNSKYDSVFIALLRLFSSYNKRVIKLNQRLLEDEKNW